MRWIIVIAAVAEAGFMVVDGVRALTIGDYFTPSSGAYAGQLGPWAAVVRSVGLDPRSTAMKWIFVVYGVVWLVVIGAFAMAQPWAWRAMLGLAVGSLWYLVGGTVISGLLIVLLIVVAR